MADSMIPYSFIPGTKARANEVNANFIALANLIASYKSATTEELTTLSGQLQEKITELLENKADKTELNKSENITESETNLDDYKKAGSYIFSSEYTPTGIPKGTSGILITIGDETTTLKQIWITDEENPEMFTRSFAEGEWQDWTSTLGITKNANTGYIKFPNNFKIQWGWRTGKSITYPIAFSTVGVPVIAKQGYTSTNGDTGFTWQGVGGFTMETVGLYSSLNWIAVGF